MRTLIKNAAIVTVDPALGNLPAGDILIDEGRIVDVRPRIEAEDVQVIDGTDCIATPGFVDTHHHVWQGPMRGVVSDWSIVDYFSGVRMFSASFFRPQDMYAAQFHGGLEALNAGVTTTADYCHNVNSPAHAEESVRGLKDSGARVVWCFGFNRPPLPQPAFSSLDDRVDFIRRFASRHFSSKDSLLTLGVCPEEGLWWTDERYGARQFEIARELDARIFFHTNTTRKTDGSFYEEVNHLSKAGLLREDVVLVHMSQSVDSEWDNIAAAGAHVSFTPETEIQMSLGWPNIAAARSRNINISFGIDVTSNNSADLLFALRLAMQTDRLIRSADLGGGGGVHGLSMTCEEALYWGTMGGAKACGLDHKIGSITPGKAADIVLHRANDISMAAWNRRNPAAAVILHSSIHTIDTVLVDGRIAKLRGHLAGDVRRAVALVEESSAYIHEQADRHGGFAWAANRGIADFQTHIAAAN